MSDWFELLGEPRRPWLEVEPLRNKFLKLSAEVHPDRVHNAPPETKHAAQQRYTALNQAYQCLREPKARLEHLLELELGAKPPQVQAVPAELMDRAMNTGALCRQVDAFLAEKSNTTSPLLQVQLFECGQQWLEKLTAAQKDLDTQNENLLAELRALDTDWSSGDVHTGEQRQAMLARLAALYRLFSYFGRWSGQLRERMTQLSF